VPGGRGECPKYIIRGAYLFKVTSSKHSATPLCGFIFGDAGKFSRKTAIWNFACLQRACACTRLGYATWRTRDPRRLHTFQKYKIFMIKNLTLSNFGFWTPKLSIGLILQSFFAFYSTTFDLRGKKKLSKFIVSVEKPNIQ